MKAPTSIDVNNLRIQDKQIELAITDDSTLVTDTAADDAGMVVRVTGNDKNGLGYNPYKCMDK